MNSLREEIFNLLASDDAYNSYENIDIDYCIKHILKMIEKRIDSTIEDIKHDIEFQSKHEIYNKPDLSIALHHLYEFKEMLK